MKFFFRLFEKSPKIKISPDGRLYHIHKASFWRKWNDRYRLNPLLNWRNHSGNTKK